MQRVVYTLPQFCETFQTGKTKAYEEIGAGRLNIVKIGRKTLVTHESAMRWLALCEQDSNPSPIGELV